MARSAHRIRPPALLAALTLLWSCTADDSGIRRLPLEPDASPGVLTVSPKAFAMGWIGQTANLTAQVTTGDGKPSQGFTYTWRSLDQGVVTVDANGGIVSVAEGTARVVVTIMNLADTATVTVKRIPATITVSADSLLFTLLGKTSKITSTVLDGGGVILNGAAVTWTTSNTAVATVGADGTVTAVGQGRADVTATSAAARKVVRVRVSVGPSGVSVSPASVSFDALGDSVQLVATVKDAAGGTLADVPVTFTSNDTTIAKVSGTGLVSGRKVGNTTVTARADSVSRTVAVAVTQKIASVTVAPDSVTLIPGGTQTFTAAVADRNGYAVPSATVAWTTSDTLVATVSAAGLVTGQGAGTATIVASSGGQADTARVTVLDVTAATADVQPSTLTLAQGQTGQLTVKFYSAEGQQLSGLAATWSSSNTAVAQVNGAGLVTAVGAGSAWVKAVAQDSLAASDSAQVTVTSAVPAFDIEVRYVGTAPTAAQQAAFDTAEARWEQIILGDLADVPMDVTAAACGIAHPAVTETVDDLLIFAQVDSIDGSGGVLGQAGPCFVRTANGLTIIGVMEFDEADLTDLEASGDLSRVIIHEMGHVLGFGASTPWDDILVDKGLDDPYWPGAQAVARYAVAGGTAVRKVPVANTGGTGTRDAHWREAHMGAELMTGYLDSGVANPLSSITVGALQDMGYVVDLGAADGYTVFPGMLRAAPGRLIQLLERPAPPPILVTPEGRMLPRLRLR